MSSRAGLFGRGRNGQAVQQWHLVRKLLLLLLLVVALTLGLVLLNERGYPTPTLMFNLLADAAIGLAMGFGCRLVLRQRHWTLKVLVSTALSIVGLLFLGLLTDFQSGIGPVRFEQRQARWLTRVGVGLEVPVLPQTSSTDGLDLAHMVVAVNLSWLALRGWERVGHGASPRKARRSWRKAPALPKRKGAQIAVREPSATPARRPVKRLAAGSAPGTAAVALRHAGSTKLRRRVFRRRHPVQLAAFEEHRCPYCLEDIVSGDGRASVECPICHTLHHKDCWDITGTCQVPHLNG